MPSHRKREFTPLIKVCGMTHSQDIQDLESLGVDYLGFNFCSRSPRHILPEQAAELTPHCRKSIPVGIFVDEPLNRILRIGTIAGIVMAQLHGNESIELANQLPWPVIKAFPGNDSHREDLRPWASATTTRYLLLDSRTQKGFGGTGNPFEWNRTASLDSPLPLFLAGGLHPENVKEAFDRTAAFALDLNSGVEIKPGRKDPRKVEACLEALQKR